VLASSISVGFAGSAALTALIRAIAASTAIDT
jgi:hypothetical protein